MKVPFNSLVGQDYTAFSLKAESQRSLNVFRQRVETDEGVNPFVLYRSPGLSLYIDDMPWAGIRGGYDLNNHQFWVNAGTVYDYVGATQQTSYAGLVNDGLPVAVAASTNSLMILSGGTLHRINSGVMTTIATAFNPIAIAFLKNYFIALADNNQFYWSENDGVTFPAANVQTFESDANNCIGLVGVHPYLVLVGSKVSQIYYVGTNPNAPFVPNDGGAITAGCVAAAAIGQIGDVLIWPDRTKDGQGKVVALVDYTPVRVSNHAIENAIRSYGDVSNAYAWTYSLMGQDYYRITFPTADKTWELNFTLREWEEVSWYSWRLGTFHRNRGSCAVAAEDNRILVGDHTNGKVYELSPDTYFDYGFPQYWLRRSPHILGDNNLVSHQSFEVGAQTGVGLSSALWLNNYSLQKAAFDAAVAALVPGTITQATADLLTRIYDFVPYTPLTTWPSDATMAALGFYAWGDDPQMQMRYSNDGGKNFSASLSRSMGRAGTDRILRWDRCGTPRDRVYEVSGSDPCRLAITTGWIDVEELAS